MFLLLNAFIASIDGFIIGSSLRFSHIKLTKSNIIAFFFGNVLIYFFSLFLYYYFHLTFMTKNISTILYLLLAFHSLKEEETPEFSKKLTKVNFLLLILTHSLDGTIVSLNFVYNYSLYWITFIFSFFSIFLLLAGYYSSKKIKEIKNSHYLSFFLFLLLAILNYFL